jgi:hypothetical protein
MKWTEVLEQRKALLVGGVALICLVALLVTARRFNITLDVYWHIRTGMDWLFNGLSPWQDHYSFTFFGEPIKSQAWMFQALVGWLVSQFGVETGLEILRITCFAAVFGLVFLFLKMLKSPALVYLLVLPVLVLLLQYRPVARPEIISYSLIVVSVMLYYRARLQMSVSTMWPIVLLVWAWSNYHSAIFAYVIFFGLFVDTAVRYLRERVAIGWWLQWLGWGLSLLAVGTLKPGFGIPVLGLLVSSPDSFSPEWKDLILEYTSLGTRLAGTNFIFALGIYATGLLAAVTIALAFASRYFGMAVVCILLIYFAIDMSRLVTPNGVAILCFFAWMIKRANSTKLVQYLPSWSMALILVAALGGFGLSMYSVVLLARQFMADNRTFTTGFPIDVTDYMIENGISGRIFNEHEHGGYLIYRLAPDSKVYIDGRTNILYPPEHARHFVDAKFDPGVLAREIEKYDIDLALLNNSKRTFTVAYDTNVLKLDYVGFEHSLFRKDDPNFPVLGMLLARPACWNVDYLPDVLTERDRALQILPQRSLAIEYFKLLVHYATAADQAAFLAEAEGVDQWNDQMLRFAGYRALERGLDDKAWELFARLRGPEFADFLAVAVSRAAQGDWGAAESVLDNLTSKKWAKVKQFELGILYRLLDQIRRNAGLQLFDEAYLEGLAGQFPDTPDSDVMPSVDSFCLTN